MIAVWIESPSREEALPEPKSSPNQSIHPGHSIQIAVSNMNDIDNKVAETAADNDRQLKKLKSANEIPPSKPKDIGTLHYDSKRLLKNFDCS